MGHLLKACQTYKSRDMRLDNAFVLIDSSILKTNVQCRQALEFRH